MPLPALTRDQVRRVDRIAIERYGIAGIVLMENAGLRAAERILALAPARVAILAGGGNNGGDGYVIARQLAIASFEVLLFATHALERLPPDAATNRRIAEAMGLAVRPIASASELAAARPALASASLLVDALLGTGFRGTVREPTAAAIGALEQARVASGATVVAIDLPSGLDCDTGEPSNATVRADRTLTFVARKAGFARPGAERWTGAVDVLSIGAPPAIVDEVRGA